MASPAKALADRLVLSRSLPALSRRAMQQWLMEDLRLDSEQLGELNLSELRACLATGYKQRQLGTLLSVVETLQQELAS